MSPGRRTICHKIFNTLLGLEPGGGSNNRGRPRSTPSTPHGPSSATPNSLRSRSLSLSLSLSPVLSQSYSWPRTRKSLTDVCIFGEGTPFWVVLQGTEKTTENTFRQVPPEKQHIQSLKLRAPTVGCLLFFRLPRGNFGQPSPDFGHTFMLRVNWLRVEWLSGSKIFKPGMGLPSLVYLWSPWSHPLIDASTHSNWHSGSIWTRHKPNGST